MENHNKAKKMEKTVQRWFERTYRMNRGSSHIQHLQVYEGRVLHYLTMLEVYRLNHSQEPHSFES